MQSYLKGAGVMAQCKVPEVPEAQACRSARLPAAFQDAKQAGMIDGAYLEAQDAQSSRSARVRAAFEDFDAKQTGRIDRTYLEALVHLSSSHELNDSDVERLSATLDKITDRSSNTVSYKAFVDWLYAREGSNEANSTRSVSAEPGNSSRPLSRLCGRTLANLVRQKATGYQADAAPSSVTTGTSVGISGAGLPVPRGLMRPPKHVGVFSSPGEPRGTSPPPGQQAKGGLSFEERALGSSGATNFSSPTPVTAPPRKRQLFPRVGAHSLQARKELDRLHRPSSVRPSSVTEAWDRTTSTAATDYASRPFTSCSGEDSFSFMCQSVTPTPKGADASYPSGDPAAADRPLSRLAVARQQRRQWIQEQRVADENALHDEKMRQRWFREGRKCGRTRSRMTRMQAESRCMNDQQQQSQKDLGSCQVVYKQRPGEEDQQSHGEATRRQQQIRLDEEQLDKHISDISKLISEEPLYSTSSDSLTQQTQHDQQQQLGHWSTLASMNQSPNAASDEPEQEDDLRFKVQQVSDDSSNFMPRHAEEEASTAAAEAAAAEAAREEAARKTEEQRLAAAAAAVAEEEAAALEKAAEEEEAAQKAEEEQTSAAAAAAKKAEEEEAARKAEEELAAAAAAAAEEKAAALAKAADEEAARKAAEEENLAAVAATKAAEEEAARKAEEERLAAAAAAAAEHGKQRKNKL
eukprot:TRINITY_DN6895_c0_g1_i13.p1 TRINITY_DN6895_c0_g1~~TRINITY_DN6895_c0_g1_i13.p1  ORF type:complete len:693 (-),score=201.53 TRINITY_DN6895_c0_g1_i13:370-2448(-)